MPSLSPLVSPPKPASSNSSNRPRRLVKPLRSTRDLEQERARRIAWKRGRKRLRHAQMLGLAIGVPVAAVLLGLGVRWATSGPNWPRGTQISSSVLAERAPIFAGGSWFLGSRDGSVWRAKSGESKAQKVWSNVFPAAPQIVALPDGAVVAGHDGALARLDTKGRALWSFQHPGALSIRPVVTRIGTVVGGDDAGRIWARDARNGKALWSHNTGAPVGEGLSATPWGVIVPLLGSARSRGGLGCFSVQDGKEKWRFPANPSDRAAGTATPRFDAATSRVFWCNDEGAVFALDARTGRKIWKTFASPRKGNHDTVLLRASPVLVGKTLFVGGGDGGLRAFDAQTGRSLWTRWLGEPLSSPLGKARFEGRVVVVAGVAPVVLVDAESGEVTARLGEGTLSWNGREFAGADESGTWHFWKS